MHYSIQLAMKMASSLSIAACALLCIYLLLSSKMRKVCYQIIFLISLCDMFAAIGTVFGLTTTGTPECWVQSILTQIFPLASAFWTLLIGVHVIFTIRSIPIHAKTFVGRKMICLCFGIPVVVTLLPFSTSSYGCVDDEPCWCFIRNINDTPDWAMTVWYVVSFYMWIWACLLLNVGLLVYSFVSVKTISHEVYKEKIQDLLVKLLGYPIVVIVCWTCPTIYDLILVLNPEYYIMTNDIYLNLSFILPCFQGLLATLVFVMTHISFHSYSINEEVHPSSARSLEDDDVLSDRALPLVSLGKKKYLDVTDAPARDDESDTTASVCHSSSKRGSAGSISDRTGMTIGDDP